MAGNKQSSNIKVYQKKKHLNIGIIIFGVIFIYLVVTVLMYLTEKHISVYEVREGIHSQRQFLYRSCHP